MEYLELLKNKIEENWTEQVETLKEILSIRSVQEEAKEDMPFGQGVQDAFQYFLKKGDDFEFATKNVDNYGGHIEFGADGSKTMGIVCHLDTVPEGNDWSHEPFSGEILDGKIYGRGAVDNKGPAVASLFAMKALADCDFIPKEKVRLILGLDEETQWKGMDYYLSKERAPDFGFTPDADFPAINGEKGITVFCLAKKFSKTTGEGIVLRSIRGGFAANMVADNARAVVNSKKRELYDEIKEKANQFKEEKKVKINIKNVGKSLEITTQGISSHGAKPETGLNAISILMEFLSHINFNNDDVNEFIEFYNNTIGYELNGESLGCYLEDEESGQTILNVGMIQLEEKAAEVTINVRYPVTFNVDDVYEGIIPVCNKYNLGIVKEKEQKPIFIPADDDFIVTLMDIYKRHSGDEESEPMVIGGGTYARAMDNVIAFGSAFPESREVAHQKDEYIGLEELKLITLIYADAIYRLTYL